MKKFAAIILTFAILFLCACASEKGDNSTTTQFVPSMLTLPTTTTMPTTKPVIFSEWPSDLIPEKFPAPPEKSYAFEIAKGNYKTDEGNFHSDWVRIRFICPEQNFHTFTNEMQSLGYVGASKKITEGTFFRNGYIGAWQDGKNIVRINNTYTDPNNNMMVIIDIVPCKNTFPDALTKIFPKFEGYTPSTGVYCGHDSNGMQISGSYDGTFDTYWHWEYRFSKSYVGVSLDEFEAYYETLGEMGFSGVISAALVDGCDILSVDVEKKIGDTTYVAHLLFNQTTKTLDLAFSNDPSIYENQQSH